MAPRGAEAWALSPGGRRARRWLASGVGLAVSAFFAALLLHRVTLPEVAAELRDAPWRFLPAAVGIKAVGFLCLAARSRLLLSPVERRPLDELFRAWLLGFVGNNLLPARMGEMLRAGWLARRAELAIGTCVAVVSLERLLDLLLLLAVFALLVAGVAEVPLGAGAPVLALVLGGALVLALVGSRRPQALASLAGRAARPLGTRIARLVRDLALRFAEGLAALASARAVAGAVLLTAGYWGASVAGIALWLFAFGFALPWYAPLVVLVFLSLGSALPSSPAYVGTYHFFAASALALFGVAAEPATSFAIVLHAAATVPFTLVGLAVLAADAAVGGGAGSARRWDAGGVSE